MTELRADCAQCMGLCCVAPGFGRSADFAIDKPAGRPCPNLSADDSCSIHSVLRPRGFSGCTSYDCFGAGQQVTRHTYAGAVTWRSSPGSAGEMFRVFAVMRALHELLFYLTEAVRLTGSGALHEQLVLARADLHRHTRESAGTLDRLDVDELRDRVVPLLRAASERVRRPVAGRRTPRLPRDQIGRDLRGADLRAADLRGIILVGADLRGAQMQLTDLTGADLRASDVRGTDLGSTLFLSQLQVNAATGDGRTTLPAGLERPPHWARATPG